MTSLPKTSNALAILLIGYNRPEFIRRRISELGDVTPSKLIISIDGGCNQEALEEFQRLKLEVSETCQDIEFLIHAENLGLVRHITGSVSRALETHEYVLVIEDDVALSQNFVKNILNAITLNTGLNIATIGGFSPIRSARHFTWLNAWRTTKYFSAWGWCVSREVWSSYSHEINEQELSDGLKNSKIWNSLPTFNKVTWMYRFNKIIVNPQLTWDYQMQFLSFKLDLEHVLPIFRISDNEGFSDTRSTNTKELRPSWMGQRVTTANSLIKCSTGRAISRLVERLDSLTIAGDSKAKEVFRKRRLRNSVKL